jgi:hypothetical protein
MILEEYLDAEYASAVNHQIVRSLRLVRKITTRFDGYLRFRYFPHLPNFPHHCHVGDEEIVQPSEVLHVTELLDLIELMTERQ